MFKAIFISSLILFGTIFTVMFRVDLIVSAPMTHYLLRKGVHKDVVYFDLTEKFFKNGASKTEILSRLSRKKYNQRNGYRKEVDLEPNEYSYWRLTPFGFGTECSVNIRVKFDAEDRLSSIKGSNTRCII